MHRPRRTFRTTHPRTARVRRAVVVGVVACTGVAASWFGAGGSTAEPSGDFYTPPAQFDATPGAIIKSAAMPVLLAPPTAAVRWPVPAQRVMYTSRLQNDAPVAVSGTFIDATRPWQGSGARPTIVIAPGTVGQGTQCAPSLAFSTGIYADLSRLSVSANQEAISAVAWNLLGARVFVTDYIGLGTPGVHTYANRLEEAHAVLDAARAAENLSGSGPQTPLVLWGYSQGGGATAAAAELQPVYAPELNLKGTWSGAPPSDLAAVVRQIDGNLIGAAIGFAINGFLARYPELQQDLDKVINPAGRALLATVKTECVADIIAKQPFTRTSDLTIDHRPLIDHLQELPDAVKVIHDQLIGTLTPSSPVLMTSGINDDTIPYGQVRQLAVDWCDKGATVTFRTNNLPPIAPGTTFANHFGPELIDGFGTNNAISYLVDRLNGKPLQGCTFD
ncbi:lipase family protein [Nocardia sp. NBC_01388]|uniref:lipase family protein n=1 Tax=Nocardia sp. NBC_01388 TaxID=2903596 RepID=UPI00324A0989